MNDGDEEDLDRLPLDDQDPLERVVRMRRGLRERRDENAQRVLDVTDRMYGAQVRAAKATVPEEQLLALVQALAHATEGFVLTVNDAYALLDRIDSELRPLREHLPRLQAAAEQIEKLGVLARDGLMSADKDWNGVAEAVARRVAASAERLVADVGLESWRLAKVALWIGGLLVLVTSLCGYFAWRPCAGFDAPNPPSPSSSVKVPDQTVGSLKSR